MTNDTPQKLNLLTTDQLLKMMEIIPTVDFGPTGKFLVAEAYKEFKERIGYHKTPEYKIPERSFPNINTSEDV